MGALDWGQIDEVRLYLVMNLIEGAKPLDLRSGERTARLARWRQSAEIVRAAHEAGVIHRDLKPANFLQAPSGAVSLTDFGLAKVVGETEDVDVRATITRTGAGFGTAPYMPPEQLEDSRHADERADVYALGCMLFQALIGQLPYPGASPSEVISGQMKVRAGLGPPPIPRYFDATVPRALSEVCARAITLDPEKRLRSVAELLAGTNTLSA